jgi:Fe-S cluster biogenesis protein NfuA
MLPTVEQIEMTLCNVQKIAQSHDGQILVIEVKPVIDNYFDVVIKLVGACSNCAISEFTIKYGIERSLRQQFSNFKSVILIDN